MLTFNIDRDFKVTEVKIEVKFPQIAKRFNLSPKKRYLVIRYIDQPPWYYQELQFEMFNFDIEPDFKFTEVKIEVKFP